MSNKLTKTDNSSVGKRTTYCSRRISLNPGAFSIYLFGNVTMEKRGNTPEKNDNKIFRIVSKIE